MRYKIFVVGVVVVIIVLVVVYLSWLECTCTERILSSFLTINLSESPHPFYQSGFNDLGLIGESYLLHHVYHALIKVRR